MSARKIIFYSANSLIILLLTTVGISLLIMREQRVPKLNTESSGQTIINNQFLILVSPHAVPNIKNILEPLNLVIKLPILNWLLVESTNISPTKYLSLESPEAETSRNILNTLLQHPNILDAQHNFYLSTASQEQKPDLLSDFKISNNLNKNIIAIVDDFLYQNKFTFIDRFPECLKQVKFFDLASLAIPKYQQDSAPHGEIMLQVLGACASSSPRLLAVERPGQGHAQTFVAALFAANINICENSIVPCSEDINLPKASGVTPDILLLPFVGEAPDLLQFSSDIIFALKQKNIIIISPAGNNHDIGYNYFPGATPGVLNIGSLDSHGNRSKFSNWGPGVDLFAPGEKIKLSYPNGLKQVSGTSLAAAHTALAVSAMKSVNPSLDYPSAQYFLKQGAQKLTCDKYCHDQKCRDLCCLDNQNTCGQLALDMNSSVKLAQTQIINHPVLDLDKNYILFLRDEILTKNILIKNISNTPTNVKAISYDSNILINPASFILNKNNLISSSSSIEISLIKEPFMRQTFKIEFIALSNNQIFDKAQVYLEYIPKKY